MKRRLRIAGTAFGALLVPACAGVPSDATVKAPPQAGVKPAPPLVPATQAAKPRASDRFGDLRVDQPPPVSTAAASPATAPAGPNGLCAVAAAPPPSGPPLAAPSPPIQQAKAETLADAPKIALPPIPTPDPIKPAPVKQPSSPEPVPDADGVVRPSGWPDIKGLPTNAPAHEEPKLVLPVPGDLPPAAVKQVAPPPDRAPLLAPVDGPTTIVPPASTPPALPPGVIGSTQHQAHASPASALGTDSPESAVERPVAAAGDTPLIRAVRAFQQNKPDEAVEHMKAYDPATQQILLSLLPALGRLGEGQLQQMKPAEMDVLLEQLTKVPNMLRPRASLQASNVRLCREVHNFAHVDPFPERHAFRAGDIVYLYMELANFSCVPDPKGGYAVTLASALELKDTGGTVVWRADPKEVPDQVSSPPQDYYRNFRLSVPGVPAGDYTLVIKTTDRPTGREVQKSVDLRVGAK